MGQRHARARMMSHPSTSYNQLGVRSSRPLSAHSEGVEVRRNMRVGGGGLEVVGSGGRRHMRDREAEVVGEAERRLDATSKVHQPFERGGRKVGTQRLAAQCWWQPYACRQAAKPRGQLFHDACVGRRRRGTEAW